jgi:acyl-CoA synthetase (NDP forming)
MIDRTTVRLPRELLDRARKKAAAEGVTLTQLIEDGLRSVVFRGQHGEKPKRVMPRVSAAAGGVLLGVDPETLGVIQIEEDIDYVRRLTRST